MEALVVAQRRYAELRRRLDIQCETDRGLHDELTRAIRSLELKIAASGGEVPRRSTASDRSDEIELTHPESGDSAGHRARAGKSRPS